MAEDYVDALDRGLWNGWERKLSSFWKGIINALLFVGSALIPGYLHHILVHVALYFPVPPPSPLHSCSSGSEPWRAVE